MSKDNMDYLNTEGAVLAGPERSEGERSEPERSGGPAKTAAASSGGAPPDPEVLEQQGRRRFTAAYKAGVVREALNCREHGEIGALLRREGLYSSHLYKWRAQYERGALRALADDTRGPQSTHHPLEEEVQRLRKQNARLEGRIKQAEAIIEIQKKVSEMLGMPLASIGEDEGEH